MRPFGLALIAAVALAGTAAAQPTSSDDLASPATSSAHQAEASDFNERFGVPATREECDHVGEAITADMSPELRDLVQTVNGYKRDACLRRWALRQQELDAADGARALRDADALAAVQAERVSSPSDGQRSGSPAVNARPEAPQEAVTHTEPVAQSSAGDALSSPTPIASDPARLPTLNGWWVLVAAGFTVGVAVWLWRTHREDDPIGFSGAASLGLQKAKATLERHVSAVGAYPGFELKDLTLAIGRSVEAQLMVLAFSTALIDIAWQDAAYDQGLLSPVGQWMGDAPAPKLSDKDLHQALWALWEPFSDDNAARTQLSGQYRLVLEEGLAEPAEAAFYNVMRRWCHAALADEFGRGMKPDVKWLEFVGWLGRDNADAAEAILAGMTQEVIAA